jgi:hypothetical protein
MPSAFLEEHCPSPDPASMAAVFVPGLHSRLAIRFVALPAPPGAAAHGNFGVSPQPSYGEIR